MVLSEAQQHDAYREARDILKLGQKWQELMPGEKRPNFERAARSILKRALGHRVERNEEALDVHNGHMHEHQPREAHLVERYLKNGTVHPDALHSFVHGRTRAPPRVAARPPVPDIDDLPDFDVFVQDLHRDQTYPAHYHPARQEFAPGHSDAHETMAPRTVKSSVPEGAVLPSSYEAVH